MGGPTLVAVRTPFAAGVRERLPLLLTKLGDDVLMRATERLATDAGLTGRQYVALAVLVGDEPPSQLELARLIGKVPALVVAIIDELETLGLVARTRDPADRRRTRVTPTRAGRRALAKGDAVSAAVEEELFGHLPVEQREALAEALRSVGATDAARDGACD